jgi:hypothetical protein
MPNEERVTAHAVEEDDEAEFMCAKCGSIMSYDTYEEPCLWCEEPDGTDIIDA